MKEEWKGVLHSTWLKIVLIAIITIPTLYAGIFLGSMWDPYGNTKDIPVAVVNHDEQVEYQGSVLDVGKELVENLKDNESMKFTFVDDTNAMEGLKDGTYYMVITIPSDFSRNATTLLDEHPEKMKLEYTTNPGSNYIATKIDDSAMAKIKEHISASVTKTYADTLFSQVKELSSGLKDASDGSGQLAEGVVSAQDGSQLIQKNLQTLANSTLTFENGTDTLVQGLTAYTQGAVSADEGARKLHAGISSLNQNSTALIQGVSQLQSGALSLQSGISSYTGAVNQIEQGSQLLVSKNATLLNGVNQLAQGSEALYQGSGAILSGMQRMSETIGTSLDDNKMTLAVLQSGNKQSAAMMAQLADNAKQLKPLIDQASEQQQAAIATLKSIQTSDEVSAKKLEAVIQGMEQNNDNYTALSQTLEQLAESGESLSQLLQGDAQMLDGLSQGLQQVKTTLDAQGNTPQTTGLIQGMQSICDNLNVLNQSLQGEQGLVSGVKSYIQGVEVLSQGASEINENSAALQNGAQQLTSGTTQLNDSVPALSRGITELFNGSNALSTGTAALTQNNSTLLNGAQALQDGSVQLHSGANQLAQGSDALVNGLGQLKDGTSTLQTSLADGAQKSNINVTTTTTEMMASPVELNHQEISIVENNGHAMAPYMMSVGLYVACMAFTLMYPLLKNNIHTKSGFKLWLSKAGVMYVISTIMAIVMITALMLINGLSPYQTAQTFGVAVLASAAFMSMIVFFSITCGKIGSFVVLIFMVLQLGGAAGTYPIETSGSFYNTIHPFMPFSYSVDAFRHTLAAGGDITIDILVFLGMFLVFSVLSILFYRWKASISEEQYEQTVLAKFH